MDTINQAQILESHIQNRRKNKTLYFAILGVIIFILLITCLIFGIRYLIPVDKTTANYAMSQLASGLRNNDSSVVKYLNIGSIENYFITDLRNHMISSLSTSTGLDISQVGSMLSEEMVTKTIDPKGDLAQNFTNFISQNDNSEQRVALNTVFNDLSKIDLNSNSTEVTKAYTLKTNYGNVDLVLHLEKRDSVYFVNRVEITNGWDALIKFLKLD